MSNYIVSLNSIPDDLTPDEILKSDEFLNFLKQYFRESRRFEQPNSSFFHDYEAKSIRSFIKRILRKDEDTLNKIKNLPQHKQDELLNLVDSLYDYWRSLNRYVFFNNFEDNKISHQEFIHKFNLFAESIITFYRTIYETILGREQTIYRILPSGGNAGILLNKKRLQVSDSLNFLTSVPTLESLVTQPPFIIKTRENKRKGVFFEANKPITSTQLDYQNCYALYINIYDTRGLVIIHKDYLGFLVALGNLFQVEPYDLNTENKGFEFILLFGTEDSGDKCYYYKDKNTYVGVCPKEAKIDYFGYAKKMILTLFNLVMIDRQLLPIHGAGVRIRRGDKTKNLFFLGDSGAGKSETLEAIRLLYKKKYQVETIFDDMGTFHLLKDGVYATGTEIGAFVRLDDLDQGYSLRSADRAVYLNIDEDNSRVVIPIEDFEMTYTLHKVDAFLLADNYTDTVKGIELYRDVESAIHDFERGERVALNTTNEKGLVSTYFANPFGPLQRKDEVHSYIDKYFHKLFADNIPIGKLYTRLSLDRKNGPYQGAEALIDLFEKL